MFILLPVCNTAVAKVQSAGGFGMLLVYCCWRRRLNVRFDGLFSFLTVGTGRG